MILVLLKSKCSLWCVYVSTDTTFLIIFGLFILISNISLSVFNLFTEDFVQRLGTHYIKSAKFGGQLEIRKTMDRETAQSKTHFSIMMEAEYKGLFSSVGASASYEQGSASNKAAETTSTSVVAQGGSQEIASILSDVYSPTFKNEFKHWLTSIPSYPTLSLSSFGWVPLLT